MLAFLIAAATDSKPFDDGIMLKLLTENGDVATYENASKVKVNGKSCDKANDIINKLSAGGTLKRRLISCKINSRGEISGINTPDGGKEIRLEKARESSLYKNNSAKLGTMIVVNTNIKIFCVPSDSEFDTAEDEKFAVRSNATLSMIQVMSQNPIRQAEK